MAPLMQLVQDSPLQLALTSAVVLAASCIGACLLIYLGMRLLGYPHSMAGKAVVSIRRVTPAELEPEQEILRPIPTPNLVDFQSELASDETAQERHVA